MRLAVESETPAGDGEPCRGPSQQFRQQAGYNRNRRHSKRCCLDSAASPGIPNKSSSEDDACWLTAPPTETRPTAFGAPNAAAELSETSLRGNRAKEGSFKE